ncbi:SDR family oxidoreductase [Pontibacter fetidus]|uniref:SDR family oxidoreductase n=1 Tax=Pontibacter fetidus TaxID=2700082 RepID=A0A6B2H3B3_9BACT|nr:SDR family oxidoreductase [Pontibacter fetidus]NDK56833.1 SDR family oxidoreductase [Pontibacter fetidus]
MEQTQKIALITGGSRGLGKNAALRLAEKGTGIILTYHTQQDEANKVVAEIEAMGQKAIALQLDVANVKSFDSFIVQVTQALQANWGTGKFDFLVNNAGIGATIPIADATEEAFDNLMNVHFKGVYFLTQKSLPLLNDGGRIINLSTGTTRFCVPGYSMYASMKGAIETFTKYLAKEVGPRGITVNVLAPGAIETDFNNAAIRNNPQVKGFLASQTALGRVGEAEDIGGIIAFLCSEDARWINAQRIEASGGMFL